ncbi:MAG TPA: hypothetical protein PKW90_11080 [Myxococcota bacterium]|nr:hypothetical protein [Myxococcota bacterium]
MLVPPSDHQATLDRLQQLSRNHLLFFRLEVGRLLLQDYFGGDIQAYYSHDPKKPSSFTEFVESCRDQLNEIGLGEQVLRQCVAARIAVAGLPEGTVERLLFSHVVELARVDDGPTRSLLAQATLENQWSSRQLRDAVLSIRAGKWIDAAPAEGLQPAAPEEEEKSPQLGRVVTRYERSVEALDQLAGQWQQVRGKKLSSGQKARLQEVLNRIRRRVAELEKDLE